MATHGDVGAQQRNGLADQQRKIAARQPANRGGTVPATHASPDGLASGK